MANGTQQPGPASASLSDLLTSVKNLVNALNGATTAFNAVNGVSTTESISAATVVKASAGRVASVSVTTGGSSAGKIYDSATANTTSRVLWVIPEAAASDGEPYVVNMPCDFGILVIPGLGQTVAVSWS